MGKEEKLAGCCCGLEFWPRFVDEVQLVCLSHQDRVAI